MTPQELPYTVSRGENETRTKLQLNFRGNLEKNKEGDFQGNLEKNKEGDQIYVPEVF